MRLTNIQTKLFAAALVAVPLSLTACGDDVTGSTDSSDDSTGGSTGDDTNGTNPSTTLTTTTNPTTTGETTSADTTGTTDPTSDTDTDSESESDTDPSSTTDATDTDETSSTAGESSSSTTGSMAECGDGVLNGDEECDGKDLGDATCPVVGDLACNDDCTLDMTNCVDTLTVCNTPMAALSNATNPPSAPLIDIIDVTEDFFVTDVNATVNLPHTYLADVSGVLLAPDAESGAALFLEPCGSANDIDARFDDDGAELACVAGPPALTGDVMPATELGDLIGISSAGSWALAVWDDAGGDDGSLDEWCLEFTLSADDPVMCGDGVAHYGEACDGDDLNGVDDCAEFEGFVTGGVVACADDCTFDTSGCVAACGDGEITPGFDEDCDGDELGGLTCDDLPGFNGGTLACAGDCSFDTSMCDASCGNGTIDDETETCDGDDLAGLTCDDFFGYTGAGLACDAACGFDFTGCTATGGIEVCSTPGSEITNGAPVNDVISVVDMGMVGDLNVQVDITHTFDADLDITLLSPAGTSAILVADECIGDDDVNAIFDDEGVALDCDFPVADSGITGTIIPEEALSVFDMEDFNGDWTLNVVDDAFGDDGTLNEWCLQITPDM